jgi:hypothetical protein
VVKRCLNEQGRRGQVNAGRALGGLLHGLGLAALVGCAPRPALDANTALQQKPETFVARVARLRELTERRPTPVLFDDEAEFQRVANQKAEREAIAPTPMDSTAVQLALGLVFAAEGARPARSFGSLHRSQMVAFYDEFLHRVHIRSRARSDEDLPFVVAHELGHSLQFQHFDIPDIAAVTDEDTRLARLALLEGDAMLVMTAVAADTHHLPLSRVLVRLAQGALEASLRGYQAALEQSPELKSALPFQRERLIFPYQAGASFVAQVHRAGGFALVNRLYELPPATTEQILHPERYLAGELAVPVQAPHTPPGWQLVHSGHVGELLVRAMLDVCNPRATTYEAASGWGGDAFTVARRGEQGVLLFVSTWDSVGDAREFEAAMRATAACWDRAPAATRAIFRGSTQVRREAAVVSVARGFSAPQAQPLLAQLPRLVGPRVASTAPFGPIVIPPVKRARAVAAPFVRGNRLIAPRVGLSIPLLPGLTPKVEGDDVTFSAPGADFASLILAISELAFSSASVRHSFDTFEQALRRPLAGDQAVSVVVAEGSVQTPLGKAVERVWRVDDTPVHGRLLLVPICGGSGMLVIGQGYADRKTREQLDQVVAGLSALTGSSPICAELDP